MMLNGRIIEQFEKTGDAAAFVASLDFEEKIIVLAILRALHGSGKDSK